MKHIPYALVYEDSDILVVNKNYNVLTIATKDRKTFHRNLQYYLNQYLKEKREKVYLVHRLDFETSGLLIFAKSKEVQATLKGCFLRHEVTRLYEAVIKEKEEERKGFRLYEAYLSVNGRNGKVSLSDKERGKYAARKYRRRNQIQIGTAREISLITGRKNQIRIGLHDLGYTLIGDTRYSKDEAKRRYLNCFFLSFPKSSNLKRREFSLPPLWIRDEKENQSSI